MQREDKRWPPVVGDEVRIKESRLSGTVIKTKGVYEARFRLHVTVPSHSEAKPGPQQRRVARLASRWYGLDELQPAPEA